MFKLILLSVILAAGIFLVFASALPMTELVGTQTVEGTAPEGTTVLVPDFPSAHFLMANLTEGPCGLRLHFLGSQEWSDYNTSGLLPAADLNCDIRQTTLTEDVFRIVVENQRGASSEYGVEFAFYRVEFPRALYALPALLLTMLGGGGLIFLFLQRGFRRTVDALLKEVKEEKEKKERGTPDGAPKRN